MKSLFFVVMIPALMLTVPNVHATNDDVNSDDTMINDIPPSGKGLFCDHPSNPSSCYDRIDNPEEFCVNNPQYTKFCRIMNQKLSDR